MECNDTPRPKRAPRASDAGGFKIFMRIHTCCFVLALSLPLASALLRVEDGRAEDSHGASKKTSNCSWSKMNSAEYQACKKQEAQQAHASPTPAAPLTPPQPPPVGGDKKK